MVTFSYYPVNFDCIIIPKANKMHQHHLLHHKRKVTLRDIHQYTFSFELILKEEGAEQCLEQFLEQSHNAGKLSTHRNTNRHAVGHQTVSCF